MDNYTTTGEANEKDSDDKLNEEDILNILNQKEQEASAYVNGQLGTERELAMRQYHRMPYGNEEEGWSQIVASDIQDTVEWILPSLLKTFSSTDKAVSFEPTKANDVEGAEQATDACNYVFYKQNNGFLVLYTAIKDMLIARNCAVMWRKETIETVSSMPFKGATSEMLAMLMQEEDAEIQEIKEETIVDEMGMPVQAFSGRMKKTEKKTICKVEAFSPQDLLVDRTWTSPLLADCPYVARMMRVTSSDLKLMGFDVDDEDLRASEGGASVDAERRLSNVNNFTGFDNLSDGFSEDESMAQGWLRIEYVLLDADGDGIAERLCVYRLKDKILKQEVCSHVPIATASPVLNAHRWDGESIADAVGDLQRLHTDLLRQTVNNLQLTNNPRTKVLVDGNGNPRANIDDILNSRVGGIIRQQSLDAVSEQVIPFSAQASMPMLEYLQAMRENRTGVSRTSQGLNPDSLNNTATGRQIDQTAAMQRVELIARIVAETLIKPIFQGILKLLTDGGMEKLAFRLRDNFVEYDPNEWRDSYDMTINVGLGTGDAQAKSQQLAMIAALQKEGMAIGLVTPKHLYHTASKIIENAGFKDIQNFVQDPSNAPPQPPQTPIEIQLKQMELAATAQENEKNRQNEINKFQAETQMTMQVEDKKESTKLHEIQASLELQSENDRRDGEREVMKAQLDSQLKEQDIEFQRWKAELDAQTKIYIEQLKLGSQQNVNQAGDLNNALAASIEGFRTVIEKMQQPKTIVHSSGRTSTIV
jgi:hypothetical protein